MDIWDALRILRRRWYVAVPVLLAFAGLAVVASGEVDAEYKAGASLVLLAPDQQVVEEGTPANQNPWLTTCGGCETVGQALGLALQSKAAKLEMGEAGWSTNYVVQLQDRTPIVHVEATSRVPADAVGTVDALIDRIATELEARQDETNTPDEQRITLDVLSQDETATGDFSAAGRVKLTLAGAGVVAACVAAFLVEGGVYYLQQRRLRRTGTELAGRPQPRHAAPSSVPVAEPQTSPAREPEVVSHPIGLERPVTTARLPRG